MPSRARALRLRREHVEVTLDQLASSATNFGAAALAAGLLTEAGFGAWSVAFAVYLVALAAVRAGASDVYVLGHSAHDTSTRQLTAAHATRASAWIATCAGTFTCLYAITVADGPTRSSLLAVGLSMPGLLLHDTMRQVAIAESRTLAALASDCAWLVATTAGLMVLRIQNIQTVAGAVLCWSIPPAIAAFLLRGHAPTSTSQTLSWLRMHRSLIRRLGIEAIVLTVSSSGMLILLTAWNANLEQTGALRGAQVLMGPAAIMAAAAGLYLRPRLVRQLAAGKSIDRTLVAQSMLGLGATMVVLVAALLTPDAIGTRIFGSTWAGAQDVVTIVSLGFFGVALASGPVSGLRASQRLDPLIMYRVFAAAVVLIATYIGGRALNENGAIVGFGCGNILAAMASWYVLRRVLPGGRLDTASEGGT